MGAGLRWEVQLIRAHGVMVYLPPFHFPKLMIYQFTNGQIIDKYGPNKSTCTCESTVIYCRSVKSSFSCVKNCQTLVIMSKYVYLLKCLYSLQILFVSLGSMYFSMYFCKSMTVYTGVADFSLVLVSLQCRVQYIQFVRHCILLL
jgi:hypothetical protein